MSIIEAEPKRIETGMDGMLALSRLAQSREEMREAVKRGVLLPCESVEAYLDAMPALLVEPYDDEIGLSEIDLWAFRLGRQIACLLPSVDGAEAEIVSTYLQDVVAIDLAKDVARAYGDADMLLIAQQYMRNVLETSFGVEPATPEYLDLAELTTS